MNKLGEKKSFFRYAALALVVVATWLVENTASTLFAPNNINLYLMVCVVTAIGMLEEELPAALYGLFGGLLMDLFTPGQLGLNSILLLLIGMGTSLVITHVMRSTILTSILFSGAALLLYTVVYWLFMLVFKGVDGSLGALFSMYLPRAALTFLLSPLIYMLIRRLRKCFTA